MNFRYLPWIPPIFDKSPFSSRLRFFFFFGETSLSFPIIWPTTGIKIKAIVNEDVKTASKVTGRKNINSPAIPGQNINGKKAANVVDVDAITGTDICRADKTKTSFLLRPSLDLLFAYSTTMIAPSIKIPTDKINANNTTTLMVTLKNDKIIIDIKKEKGIERLTRKDDFFPIKE